MSGETEDAAGGSEQQPVVASHVHVAGGHGPLSARAMPHDPSPIGGARSRHKWRRSSRAKKTHQEERASGPDGDRLYSGGQDKA